MNFLLYYVHLISFNNTTIVHWHFTVQTSLNLLLNFYIFLPLKKFFTFLQVLFFCIYFFFFSFFSQIKQFSNLFISLNFKSFRHTASDSSCFRVLNFQCLTGDWAKKTFFFYIFAFSQWIFQLREKNFFLLSQRKCNWKYGSVVL